MDVSFTAEQQMLWQTARRLAETAATTDPSDIASGETLDKNWHQLVELGVTTFRSPDLCGLEASGVETMIVVEELARTLCAVPVAGQAVLAGEMLQAADAQDLAAELAEGDLRLAPALSADLATFAGAGSAVAFDSAGATAALMARLVDRDTGTRQIVRVPLPDAHSDALDLTRALTALDSDDGEPVGEPISAARWTRVEALALTTVAADLLGVMQGALDDAVRYAGERTQFGTHIGAFQAIAHLLADAHVRVEGARSCLWHAAWAVDHLPDDKTDSVMLAARTAKAVAAAAGRDVIETSTQVFGGMAITWDHLAHLRLRRMLTDRQLFGDENLHYDAIASARLADPELV
ncbi:acyl-CoA dehydrogenase [Mycolicibacterium sp. 018/SC-01/001]|uniref:acyl-CoA dehydrogenase n=1 Tax=Mycolicibacterium sp. 018/SC-01/001 TaxID=2592069 RepID=UPI00117E4728|nr:acyl-CoA dehydrogenase [Mycolicibacterium sp. 018/SC-01/001]TRW76766.1 acyl-CoA dehydrogenase [Mycolicibacterium sp. 018/SC-01/001]